MLNKPKPWANLAGLVRWILEGRVSELFYRLEHGSYYLGRLGSDNVVLMADRIALAYSLVDGGAVLMKHGEPGSVTKWFRDSCLRYRAVGMDQAANDLGCIVLPSGFSVDEINRCLSTSGYIGRLIEKIDRDWIAMSGELEA